MALNIVGAVFRDGATTTTTNALYQWDYGQILAISGVELPDAFEAHFTHQYGGGYAKVQIGQNGSVPIPDSYLERGLNVYCYIYLHDGETDGETEYVITIPVKPRAVPISEAVTHEEQGVIQQLMGALTAAANKAEEEAESAETSASGAAASAEDAAASAGASSTSATAAAASATEAATQAATATAQATEATAQATAATQSATGAAASAAQAAGSEQTATQAAQTATAKASEAATQATAAQAAAATATTQAQAAEAAKTAAQAAQTAAEGAAEDATEEAERVIGLLDTKQDKLTAGDNITIDENNVISAAGGNYTLAYDATTGRLSLMNDGAEASFVILTLPPVTIEQINTTLRFNNVPAISNVVQNSNVLALT